MLNWATTAVVVLILIKVEETTHTPTGTHTHLQEHTHLLEHTQLFRVQLLWSYWFSGAGVPGSLRGEGEGGLMMKMVAGRLACVEGCCGSVFGVQLMLVEDLD